MPNLKHTHPDGDEHKGAVEQESPERNSSDYLRGQLGHRDQDEMLKDSDSDYPEPGSNEEHSGQHK